MTTSPTSPETPIDDRGWQPQEVTIGILTALVPEARAMASLVDDAQTYHDPGDRNTYRVGTVPSVDPARPHRIALLVMPRDGTQQAASCCANMLRTFPGIQTVVMTGIAGGIPRPDQPAKHVRLGDVVVALDGIVNYGNVQREDGRTRLRGRQGGGLVSHWLLQAARELQMAEQDGDRRWEKWLDPLRTEQAARFPRPAADTDVLYVRRLEMRHPPRSRPGLPDGMPQIHYGVIGSADVLMRDEDFRDRLADQFPDMLAAEMEGSGLAASTAAVDRTWFMVRGVADYGETTGKNDVWHEYASYAAAAYVRALLEAASPVEAGPWPLTSRHPLPLVDDADRQLLRTLLRQVPREVTVRTVWQAAVPDLADVPPDVLSTPATAYDYLAGMNADPSGLHPAILFIAHLGRAVDDAALAKELQDWAAAQASAAHATEALHARLSPGSGHRAAAATGSGPTLLIEMAVDGLDRSRCRITPFLQGAGGPWRPRPATPAEIQLRVEELERVVTEMVAAAEKAWEAEDATGPAGIEFLLPTGLLNLPVQWYPAPQLFGRVEPICVKYSVTVRSLDRMRKPGLRREWVNRWARLDRQPFAGRVRWGVNARTDAELDAWATELSGDDRYVVVVLSEPPSEHWGRQELYAALAAGVPVILWDQRLPRPEDGTRGIERLVAEPAYLPGETKALRVRAARLAAEQPNHVGRAVALLWDDPNRLVPVPGAGS